MWRSLTPLASMTRRACTRTKRDQTSSLSFVTFRTFNRAAILLTMSTIRLDPASAAWQQIDGEVVIVDLRDSRYFSLNDSAADLWILLDRGATTEELVAALTNKYGIEIAQAQLDVTDLVSQLVALGMVVSL